MKAKILILAVAVAATTTLGGCDKIKKLVGGKPSGEVVATVNGEEITSMELRAELGNFSSRDPKVMKAAEQQALQQIIMRDLVAQKARDEKLDKSPEYTVQARRGTEGLLGQLYQRKIASSVAVPTRADAETFVSSHPGMFDNRRIMVVDQVIAAPSKIDPERFKPLKTLDDVKLLFTSENVPFQENTITMDTLSVDPRLVDQIDKLPPGEVFVVPQNGALVFNRIGQTHAVPFRGEMAVNYAMNALRNQNAQKTVREQMVALRQGAESKIVYSAGYKPPPNAAAPAPGAATPPAAAPAAPAPKTP